MKSNESETCITCLKVFTPKVGYLQPIRLNKYNYLFCKMNVNRLNQLFNFNSMRP